MSRARFLQNRWHWFSMLFETPWMVEHINRQVNKSQLAWRTVQDPNWLPIW